jgi:ribonucleoside-diphosphate reductase alpha chain
MKENKIDKKITGFNVKSETILPTVYELTEREEVIYGQTIKIKPGTSEHAIYITINFQVVNEVVKPFEIFINTKDVTRFQWILYMTRTISALFRLEKDIQFLLDEMKMIIDPAGGYFYKAKKGEKSIFMPSIVAHIGMVIETTLKKL